MADDNKAAIADPEVSPAPASEPEPTGAPQDGQPPTPEAILAGLKDLSAEDKATLLDAVGREFIVREYAAKDLEREAQRRADRLSVDNQLQIDKAEIDNRFLPDIDKAIDQLAEGGESAAKAYRDKVLAWQGQHRRAEFDHAVRRHPVYSQLTEDEHRRIASVRDAPDADRVRVVIDTLLSAQERIIRAELPNQVEQKVAQNAGLAKVLTDLLQARKAAAGETSSQEIASHSRPERERLLDPKTPISELMAIRARQK